MSASKYVLTITYDDGLVTEHDIIIPAFPGNYKMSVVTTEGRTRNATIVVDKTRRTYKISITTKYPDSSTFGSKNFTITTPSLALEDLTWDEIAAISEAGKAPEVFNIGDKKILDESLGVSAMIVGFGHDDLADGSGKAGITFAIDTPLYASDLNTLGINVDNPTQMNATDTNVGGWGESKMLNQTMANLCTIEPFDKFLTNIKIVNKSYYNFPNLTDLSNKESLVAASRFFLFSYQEVMTTLTGTPFVGEGTVYKYWTSTTGTMPHGWLRTMYPDGTGSFMLVSDDDKFSSALASTTSHPIQFGFCI